MANRRQVLAAAAVLPLAPTRPAHAAGRDRGWLFVTSDGRTVMLRPDGTGAQPLEVHAPNQASWQPTGFFSDGRRVMLLSLEPATFGPDRPYDRFYWQTRTHIWSYDLQKKDLVELATKNRVAAFYTPQAMLSDDRMLVQVAREAGVQTYSMNLDGSDAQEFTRLGEGVPYGFSVSPIESESPSIWLPTGTRSTPVTRTALIGR